MFGIKDGFLGVWWDVVNYIVNIIPDWLLFLIVLPNSNGWLAVLIFSSLTYIAGRWGILSALAVLGGLIASFILGSKGKEH